MVVGNRGGRRRVTLLPAQQSCRRCATVVKEPGERNEMIFTQHYLDCLSQGSYLIGDETSGRAVVVDPRRDIDEYLSEAAEHGLHIERVIETHIHADF